MRPEILISILLSLTVFMGCKDDPQPQTELEKLPAATREGKNTFGCLVDGKAWIPRLSTDIVAFYQEGVLAIGGGDGKRYFQITIFDEHLSEQNYLLSNNIPPSSYPNAGIGNYSDNCGEFETTSDVTGTLTITHFDPSFRKWIISGTFEFEAYSEECQKTVKVTDGRFDLNYAP